VKQGIEPFGFQYYEWEDAFTDEKSVGMVGTGDRIQALSMKFIWKKKKRL